LDDIWTISGRYLDDIELKYRPMLKALI